MTDYHAFKVHLSDGQKSKIRSAYKIKTSCTIRIDPKKVGNDTLKLTKHRSKSIRKVVQTLL